MPLKTLILNHAPRLDHVRLSTYAPAALDHSADRWRADAGGKLPKPQILLYRVTPSSMRPFRDATI